MVSFNKEDVFIVTGASSGIGQCIACELIKEGASVVAVARNRERLEETKNSSLMPERFFIEIKDLSKDIESIESWVASLREKYGKFRGLSYCAGMMRMEPARVLEYSASLQIMNINYFAPIFMAKAICNKKNNIGRGTSIVAISSLAAIISEKSMAIYSGSKAGLSSSYRCIAKEVAKLGIRVNTILPADIETPMTMSDEILSIRQNRESMYPLGFGEPIDVANVVLFLLSDKAKWITAQNYIVDCGII